MHLTTQTKPVYMYGKRFRSEEAAERWRNGSDILKPSFTEEEVARAEELVDGGYKSVSRKYRMVAVAPYCVRPEEEWMYLRCVAPAGLSRELSIREYAAFRKVGGVSA